MALNSRWDLDQRIYRLLIIATGGLFLGRLLQAGIGNPSFVEILGDEDIMSPLISQGYTWTHYSEVIYPVLVERVANGLLVTWAFIFLGLAVSRFRMIALGVGAVLAILETCASLSGEYSWYALAGSRALIAFSPGILFLYLRGSALWFGLGKWTSALVFASHGLFAMNILPVPGIYGDMLSLLLGVHEQRAEWILWVAGLLDLLSAVTLLVIRPPLSWLLFWMIGWGSLTALARVMSGFEPSMAWESLGSGGAETMIRLAHGLVPWALFLASRGRH